MQVVVVKGSHCYNHVRVQKFVDFFRNNAIDVRFICWLRKKSDADPLGAEQYLLEGGGYGGYRLAIYYPLWMMLLFFHFLRLRPAKSEVFLVVDFDAAFPVFLASLFNKRIKYVYDIHDDFSLRYRFPVVINSLIAWLDSLVKSKATTVIHVDESRVRAGDANPVIIYNSPRDWYGERFSQLCRGTPGLFVVSGLLSRQRGVVAIAEFAKRNPGFRFIVAGTIVDESAQELVALANVEYLGYIDQSNLFAKIKNASGIFSLYDPSVEINRLAASNKLYDAMMLGVPVIVNKGLLVEDFVRENGVGIVVNFDYDDSWSCLGSLSLDDVTSIGNHGREIYERHFGYAVNIEQKLSAIFAKDIASV